MSENIHRRNFRLNDFHNSIYENFKETGIGYTKLTKYLLELANNNYDKIVSTLVQNKREDDLIIFPENREIDKENKNLVIFNSVENSKVIISSSVCTETELEEYERMSFDVVIHGISRITSPVEFTTLLLLMAQEGISQITIPDNKDSETRLFRDFDFQALANLMLLVSLIDVRVGNSPLRSETDVLNYCARASEHTNSARNNGFEKLTARWYKLKTEEKKLSEAQILGYYKGALKELLKRAVTVQHLRTSEEVAKWFSDNKTAVLRKVPEDTIKEVIKEAFDEVYSIMEAKLGISRDVIIPFYDLDIDRMTKYISDLSHDIEIENDTECVSKRWHNKLAIDEDCLDCDYIHQ